MSEPAPPHAPFLILFDFDETIINESSDDAVVRLLPDPQLPTWLTDTYREGHYNEFSHKIMGYLADQGITKESLRSAVERIPPAPGLPSLLQFLRTHQRHFELVVASDANTFFIDAWLKHAGVRGLFREVYTNPSGFDSSGRLSLTPFHSHSCPRCPDNMCKQKILRDHVSARVGERGGAPFQRVFYVGDGSNDVCPTQALGPRDTAFPRRGFPMHKLLLDMQQSQPDKFTANMVPWASGDDIVECLRKVVEER